jgi:hypothetical protein
MVLFALVIIAFFFSPLNLLSGIRFKRGAKWLLQLKLLVIF